MQFEINYLYTFRYVPAKHRNHQEAKAKARMSVDVAELTDGDAPVVMTVANTVGQKPLSTGHDRFLAKEDGAPRRVRMRDGYFYVEGLSAAEFMRRATDLGSLNSTYLAASAGDKAKPGKESHTYKDPFNSVREARWRARDGWRDDLTQDDEGAAIAKMISAQAKKMIIVDGVTYEYCREPILGISIKNDDAVCLIMEAPNSIPDRGKPGGYGYLAGAAYTSSLIHAEHTMRQFDLAGAGVAYEVLDPNASSYDGVASDVILHLRWSEGKMKETIKAASTGTLQAYYRLAEALRHVDDSSPSVSQEILAAAEALLDIAHDPDIDEPMKELGNAWYMTRPSGSYRQYYSPDEGGPFSLGLDHVSSYKDKNEYAEAALCYAKRALARWEGRHPESTFDNGQTQRMTSAVEGDVTVAEIGSSGQAHHACRELGCGYAGIDHAIAAGSRLFHLSGKKSKNEEVRSKVAREGVIGLVVGPAVGNSDGEWKVITTDHPSASFALQAVASHIESMDERDIELSQDQQLISIF